MQNPLHSPATAILGVMIALAAGCAGGAGNRAKASLEKPAAPAPLSTHAQAPIAPEATSSQPDAETAPAVTPAAAPSGEAYEGGIGLMPIVANLSDTNGALEGTYRDRDPGPARVSELHGQRKEETGGVGWDFAILTAHRCTLEASSTTHAAAHGTFTGECAYDDGGGVLNLVQAYGAFRDENGERPFWLRSIKPEYAESHARFRSVVIEHTAAPGARCMPSLQIDATADLPGGATLLAHWTGDPCANNARTPPAGAARVVPPIWPERSWGTFVDSKGGWVKSFPLGGENTLRYTLAIAPVDLGSDVTVKVVERRSWISANSSFSVRSWLLMQGPDGRVALAMTLPESSQSLCGMCCNKSKLLLVYAVELDGAPPKELVVSTQQFNQPFNPDACPEPHDPPVTYQAYRLNAAALRFDAFAVNPKVIKAAVKEKGEVWATMW